MPAAPIVALMQEPRMAVKTVKESTCLTEAKPAGVAEGLRTNQALAKAARQLPKADRTPAVTGTPWIWSPATFAKNAAASVTGHSPFSLRSNTAMRSPMEGRKVDKPSLWKDSHRPASAMARYRENRSAARSPRDHPRRSRTSTFILNLIPVTDPGRPAIVPSPVRLSI